LGELENKLATKKLIFRGVIASILGVIVSKNNYEAVVISH